MIILCRPAACKHRVGLALTRTAGGTNLRHSQLVSTLRIIYSRRKSEFPDFI
jgi:hypothetical protein